MTQNIYDNEEFFAGYSGLRRSVEGLDGMPEWPALRALLPDLRRRKVLDLGCGFGWFCRWAREQGANHVVGVDVSEKMLARAGAASADPAITYTRADMEQLELPPKTFDVVYSALALHYVENLSALLSQSYRSPLVEFWSSRSSTRYLPPRRNRAGRSMLLVARPGPSTATSMKGRARPIGSPRGSSSSIGPWEPTSTC